MGDLKGNVDRAISEIEKCIAVFEDGNNKDGEMVQMGLKIALSILNKFIYGEQK